MARISWENNILGFVPKTDWLDIPFEPKRQNDPIDSLFGDRKTDNLVAEYESIAAEYQIPVLVYHQKRTETNGNEQSKKPHKIRVFRSFQS